MEESRPGNVLFFQKSEDPPQSLRKMAHATEQGPKTTAWYPQLNINLFIHSLNKHVSFLLPLTSPFLSTLACIPNPPIAATEILTKCCSCLHPLAERDKIPETENILLLAPRNLPEPWKAALLLPTYKIQCWSLTLIPSLVVLISNPITKAWAMLPFIFILFCIGIIFLILGVQSYSLSF